MCLTISCYLCSSFFTNSVIPSGRLVTGAGAHGHFELESPGLAGFRVMPDGAQLVSNELSPAWMRPTSFPGACPCPSACQRPWPVILEGILCLWF